MTDVSSKYMFLELLSMMTPLNGNIFSVNGPVWGESTSHRWIPSQRPVTRSFDFFSPVPEQTAEQTIETPVIYDVIALIILPL